MHVPNKEVIQTVRTGRPTDNPKPHRLQVMLSDLEVEKLEFCHKKTNLSKGEIVRQGIYRVYQSLLNPEKDAKKEQ